jgi:hypothetical protein
VAIQGRAEELTDVLAADTSRLALRPKDPAALQALCAATLGAAEMVPALGTLSTDDLAWARWTAYCESMGTPPIRSDVLANAGLDFAGAHRETVLLSGFLMHLAETLPGRGGRGRAKPQASLNMVLAVKRIHRRMGAPMEVLPGVRRVFEAIVKSYVKAHGPDALLPKRKEPLDAPRIEKLLGVPAGTSLGELTLDWSEPRFVVFKAVLCTGFAGAFRKAEMLPPTRASDGERRCLMRDSVTWVIRGVPTATPSVDQLRGLVPGDFCAIKPPPCKNDVFGLHFGWKPIWLPVTGSPTDAAKAIAAMLIAVPVGPERRATTPLFCLNDGGETLSQSEASRLLEHLLKKAFPGEVASRWSLHSLRIGQACALLKANASMELIQAMCRWRSTQSVAVYARLGPADYGRWVVRAQRQHTDSVTAANLPRLDYDGIVALLSGATLELDQ